ncbi:MAG: radical SAM protein [Acidobacteriota bacterium]
MAVKLEPRNYYRLPWSLTDNAIAWLEPTSKCNMYCDGCYRINHPQGHKTLQQISEELDVFERLRITDGVSVAGGDPLTHPQCAEVTRMIAQRGLKPIINTNGMALTQELLRDLKQAGARGFTFHVDSYQHRPSWKGRSEIELCELRLQFAEMLAREGGLTCAFNSTVYPGTLDSVPDLVGWAQKHIDLVHLMVFIAFRSAAIDGRFDCYAGADRVAPEGLPYIRPEGRPLEIKSTDIYEKIRDRFSDFDSAAYLNGTHKPDSFKWLLSGRIGTAERIYGYVGPRFMEVAQTFHHLKHGRYLGYTDPKVHRRGRGMLWASLYDRQTRDICNRWFGAVLRNPINLFRRLHYQSIMIIQPIDVLDDGMQNMCDSCPDITVHDGELVWSCRLEEKIKYGRFVHTVPRRLEHPDVEKEVERETESVPQLPVAY